MTVVLPRWMTRSADDESSLNSASEDSESMDASSLYDSSDDERISHRRIRSDGIYGSLPLAAQKLPAAVRMPEIQEAIERNRVVCVLGNTGCGKSTVIPYCLGSTSESVRILVTQPRRMAAISLCEHLQKSFFGRQNHTGAGYRVRGSRTDVEETKIVYVTAGYLKTMLTHNPDELSQFTHLILDEVHERGIDSDFLSLIVKRLFLLPENGGVKLIVMSATLQSELFVDYFASLNNGERPVTVTLTQKTKRHKGQHKITEFFVEDLSPENYYYSNSVSRLFDEQIIPTAQRNETRGIIAGELSDAAQNLIVEIIQRDSNDGFSTLVFLPGIGEIYSVHDKLVDALYRTGKAVVDEQLGSGEIPASGSYFHIFTLFSQMPFEEQKLALKSPAARARHVVLCTNVAESSLTVPCVDMVIDSGLRRANSYDARMGLFRLTSVWCSQASSLQRRGRTGRVCDGRYYKMFTREFYETLMPPHDTPEVLVTDLSCVFLNAKYISEFWKQPEGGRVVRPSSILRELISPPRLSSVKAAVDDLFEAGILRHEPDEMSELSLLGTLATRLNVEPQIARLIFFAWLSGMVCEGLILAAACGMDSDVIRGTTKRSYPGKDDYCKQIFNFMWYRNCYDMGSMSEPISSRNLLWSWLCYHYKLPRGHAPEYHRDAAYAKEFDTFKRSVLNHCSQFISWIDEEIGDERSKFEAEILREFLSERCRSGSLTYDSITSIVFKCGTDFDKLKFLLLVASNTRLLTADAVSGDYDALHAIKFEKLQEQVFWGCKDDSPQDRVARMTEVAIKLTGRTPMHIESIERAAATAINSSWIIVPGRDYQDFDAKNAPARDYNMVKDDFFLMPKSDSDFAGMMMPIAVRTCLQIFDRRFTINFDSGGIKAKIKQPQYSNVVKWDRIAVRDGQRTRLSVNVNSKSPVGWLHRMDSKEAKVDRFWGIAGKIQGSSKSVFEDTLPHEARASNVTILPVGQDGRLGISMLLAALPLHVGGLEAVVDFFDSENFEVSGVVIEGRFFSLNKSHRYPLTMDICEGISVMRRLLAKAIDLPGTRKSESNSLAISPEILRRIVEIQNGSSLRDDEISFSGAIDQLLQAAKSPPDENGRRSPVSRRKIMLVPDSGCSYTELITDPFLWVDPVSRTRRMLFRKDQIAEIQAREVPKGPLNEREKHEIPIVRLSKVGFSVDEVNRFLVRWPKFHLAHWEIDTIMDEEIHDSSLDAAIRVWDQDEEYYTEEEQDQVPHATESVNIAHTREEEVLYTPSIPPPIPVTPPRVMQRSRQVSTPEQFARYQESPKIPVVEPSRQVSTQEQFTRYQESPKISAMEPSRHVATPEQFTRYQESPKVPSIRFEEPKYDTPLALDPMESLWQEVVEESRMFESQIPAQERLMILWNRVKNVSRRQNFSWTY
jgi:HrpA-like RNA helicase